MAANALGYFGIEYDHDRLGIDLANVKQWLSFKSNEQIDQPMRCVKFDASEILKL